MHGFCGILYILNTHDTHSNYGLCNPNIIDIIVPFEVPCHNWAIIRHASECIYTILIIYIMHIHTKPHISISITYLYILIYIIYVYFCFIYTHTLRQFVCYSLCVFLYRCNWHTTFTVVTPRSQLHPVPHLRASIGAEKHVGAIDLRKSLGGQEELRRWRFGTFVFKVGLYWIKTHTTFYRGNLPQSLGSFF